MGNSEKEQSARRRAAGTPRNTPALELEATDEAEFKRRFTILKQIGSGATGEVFLARQASLERMVAIKQLHPDCAGDKETLQRFHREAQVLSRLAHPNIVRFYEFGLVDGRPFLVNEFVDGVDLKRYLDREGGRDPVAIVRLMIVALQGLEYLHSLGIVHRDIKPANILIDSGGGLKLADFGVAQDPELPGITASGWQPGSPAYMAPERLQGFPASSRSDLYSLGVILHLAITGSLPRGTKCNSHDFVTLRLSVDPLPVSLVESGLDPELATIIDSLLCRNPDQRPASARQVRHRLQQLLGRTISLVAPAARRRTLQTQALVPATQRWSVLIPVGITVAVTVAAFVLSQEPPPPPPGEPAPVDRSIAAVSPQRVSVQRSGTDINLHFATTAMARAEIGYRQGPAPTTSEQRPPAKVQLAGPKTEFNVVLHDMEPWLDYRVFITLTYEKGPQELVPPVAVPSYPKLLDDVSGRITPFVIEQIIKDASNTATPVEARVQSIQKKLRRIGYFDMVTDTSEISIRGQVMPILLGRDASSPVGTVSRAKFLYHLALLRRLDRWCELQGLPFSSAVDRLLVTANSTRIPLDVAPHVLKFPIPSSTTLSLDGPALQVSIPWDPKIRAANSAELVMEVDYLDPSMYVPCQIGEGENAIQLELWGPNPATRNGVVRVGLLFDPRLISGDRLNLQLGLGFLPVEKSEEAMVINRSCNVHSLGLLLR